MLLHQEFRHGDLLPALLVLGPCKFLTYISIRIRIANLIRSYRVSCACEPSVLSIPNGISRTVRDTTVVRITRPSIFFFWFGVARLLTSDSRAR
jgi:hypothetical protein